MKNIINKKNILALSIIALASAVLRLYINYSTEFMPGAVGAFYLVQVRSVIETGSLAFKDFPLIFYIEAVLAKSFIVFGSVDINIAVDNACRIFDAAIPPLSIFPAYFLISRIFNKEQNDKMLILFSSFSVLYISFFTLVSDYQKNSLGLLWLFCLLFFVYSSFQGRNIKDYIFAILFFVLIGITHFGIFVVSIFFLLIVFTVNYFKLLSMKRLIRFIVELLIVLFVGLGTVYFFSYERFVLLIKAPSQIFKDPIFFSLFSRTPIISPADILNVFFINVSSLYALVVFLRRHLTINNFKNVFTVSSIISCLILASPFLGVEWGQRLYLISYVFVLPVLIFLYEESKNKLIRYSVAGIVFLVLAVSTTTAIFTPQVSNMNKEGYKELTEIKNNIQKNGSVLMVAKLGLNYWVSWITRMNNTQEEYLKAEWWKSIDNIYYLKQVKGNVPFGTAGLFGRPFENPEIPKNAQIIYKGKLYNLYLVKNPPEHLK